MKEANIKTLCPEALIYDLIYKIQKIQHSFANEAQHPNHTTFSTCELEFLRKDTGLSWKKSIISLLSGPLNSQGNHFSNSMNPTPLHPPSWSHNNFLALDDWAQLSPSDLKCGFSRDCGFARDREKSLECGNRVPYRTENAVRPT